MRPFLVYTISTQHLTKIGFRGRNCSELQLEKGILEAQLLPLLLERPRARMLHVVNRLTLVPDLTPMRAIFIRR